MAPPETLTDGIVFLRRWHASDAQAQSAAARSSMSELARWMTWAKASYSVVDAAHFIAFADEAWRSSKEYHYAIIVDGLPQGSFGLRESPDRDARATLIGYWLATPLTGRGLATRAAALLTQAAFELGLTSVHITHHVDNERSGRIPARLGFRCRGANVHAVWGEDNVLWTKDGLLPEQPQMSAA